MHTTIFGRAVSIFKEVDALYYEKGYEVNTGLPGINVIDLKKEQYDDILNYHNDRHTYLKFMRDYYDKRLKSYVNEVALNAYDCFDNDFWQIYVKLLEKIDKEIMQMRNNWGKLPELLEIDKDMYKSMSEKYFQEIN